MANLKDIGYGVGKYLTASDASDIPDIGTNRKNLDLLNFKIATNNAYALYNFKDGMIDAYQTEAGVDTGTSTNETYDSSGKYYSGSAAANATGGTVTSHGSYTVNTFLTSSNFIVPGGSANVAVLVVGGGGGGGGFGGGGGAGGFRTSASHAVTAQTYAITVGDGGTAGIFGAGTPQGVAGQGGDSIFDTITSAGGGKGSGPGNRTGYAGGSGSGGADGYAGGAGNTPSTSPVQGYAGGGAGFNVGGGGGGAANVGYSGTQNTTGGPGGGGSSNDYRTGSAVYYSGGGGGGTTAAPANWGGNGGAGPGSPAGGGPGNMTQSGTASPGTANTGGGGGGGGYSNGGAGGSGIVVIRYTTNTFTSYVDMTLVSNAQTANAVPTEGRLMIYEETSTGSTTLDTDLKGYVSRDGGTTYTQTPLTLDTTYETGKTLVSGSVDISGQPSGTNMKYKIETLNQSASKVCRLHGASLLWA